MTPCSFQYFPCLGQNSQFNYIAQDKGQNPRRLVLQPFKAIHVRVIAFVYLECKTNFIKQIRSIVQVITLFITRTDSHKIIYPVYLYLYNGQQLFFLTLDFYLLHLHIRFPTDELLSAGVMSLVRAHITKTKTSPLLTKK